MDSPEKTLSRSVSELQIINVTIFGSVRKLKHECILRYFSWILVVECGGLGWREYLLEILTSLHAYIFVC